MNDLIEEKKKISKSTIVFVLAFILLAAGAGLYFFGSNKETKTENSEEKQETPNDNKEPVSNNINIVGEWVDCYIGEDVDNEMSFIFNEDGTGSYIVDDIPLNVVYKIDGNTINLGVGGMKENPYSLSIEGNVLTIKTELGGWTCTKK